MGYYSDKISFFIMRFICAAFFLFALYLTFHAFHNSNILLLLVAALPIGMVATLLFIRYYLPGIAESFADFLLMPRHFLKKAPIILSSHYGDLANGAYQKVIHDLQALPSHAFCNPEVVLIYAQACMKSPGYVDEGLNSMEKFFHSAPREKENRYNLQLLLFYADSARNLRPAAAVVQLLKKEAQRRCYNESEKRAILTRCAALRKVI